MKLADLHKSNAMKIANSMKPHGSPGAPGQQSAAPDRREQRRLDQARGLVPFACKLNGDLIKQLQAIAGERKVEMGEVVGELLTAALAGGGVKVEPKAVPKPEPKTEAKAAPTPAPKVEVKAAPVPAPKVEAKAEPAPAKAAPVPPKVEAKAPAKPVAEAKSPGKSVAKAFAKFVGKGK